MKYSPEAISLPPELADEIEALLKRARSYPLLEALCLQRMASGGNMPWQSFLRLRDAQRVLKRPADARTLAHVIDAAADEDDRRQLTQALLRRRDWEPLMVLLSRQAMDHGAPDRIGKQFAAVARRALAEGCDLSDVLKLLPAGPRTLRVACWQAQARAAAQDHAGAEAAWRFCARMVEGVESPAQLSLVLGGLQTLGDTATLLTALVSVINGWAHSDTALRNLVVKALRELPTACDLSPLSAPLADRQGVVDAVASSMVRLKRWDLLAQLRWEQLQRAPGPANRSRWLAALRHCGEPLTLRLLWEHAAALSEAALADLIADLTKVGHGSVVDGMLRLAEDGLPESLPLTAAWVASLERRNNTALLRQAYVALIVRMSRDAEGLADLSKALRRLEWWDLLTRVRLAQWRLSPRRDTVTFHIKALRAAGQDQLVGRFLSDLAQCPATSAAIRSFLVRAMDSQGETALLRQYAAKLQIAEPENPQPWIELIEYWTGDASLQDKLNLDRHAEQLKRRLLAAQESVATDAESEPPIALGLVRADKGSWLGKVAKKPITVPSLILERLVEALAEATHRRGVFEVWQGYEESDIKSAERHRRPNDIRVARRSGELLAWIVLQHRPSFVLEVGSGFGTSGMYMSAALEELGDGRLITFEPNPIWFEIARDNIARVSPRATAVHGPFEDHAATVEDASVGVAFVDAIHTPEAVAQQLEAMKRICRPGAIIIIDDVQFSDRMHAYWQTVASSPEWAASAEYAGRFGLLELKPTRDQ